MVDLIDIPDFPGQPGQAPTPGAATAVAPIPVVLVTAPLDASGTATPLNAAAVDAFIAAEVTAGRAYESTVERWAPWSDLDLPLGYGAAVTYNYGRFTVGGRNYYAYLDVNYQNLTTSTFVPTPDDWSTYAPKLGYSTVVRGHVAVAASQSDTYGDLYLTAPEPIDAPPVRGYLSADLLGSTPSGWTVLVISTNDLRGGTGFPFFDKHVKSDEIASAGGLASSATVDSDAHVLFDIPDATYPWTRVDGAPTTHFFWPFPASTWNMNNGFPEDNFRTIGRPTHKGMDMGFGIANTTGAPIRAIAAGIVTYAEFNSGGYGNRVVIDHGNGYESTYNHMYDTPSVTVGQTVTIGTVLGGIGSTGDATGNHLHFEIYQQSIGDVIDPLIFMAEFNPLNLVVNVDPVPVDIEVYVPRVTASPVSTIDGVAAGGGAYLFTPSGFAEYMTVMQGAPWVLGGITDVRLVPSWAVGGGGDATFTAQAPTTDPGDPLWAVADIPVFRAEVATATTSPTVLAGWRDAVLGSLDAAYYRKIVTAPFTELLVGNGQNAQTFRPDQWHASGLSFLGVTGAAHGDPSIRLIPEGYNELGSQLGLDTPVGGHAGIAHSGYGMAASNVATNDLSPYLAAFSSHQTWLVANLNRQLAVTLGLTQIQLNAGVQGIQTILGGAAGATGGVGGAISGAVGALPALATAGITASNTINMLDVSTDGSFDITAYQLGLSGEAAVASFDSWFQSLSSNSGTGSPEVLASSWRAIVAQGFQAIVAVPAADAVSRALSLWRRFGYMIDRAFVPPRLDAMDHFTYWQLEAPTILGNMPADARTRIAERFERGTTIWTNVAEIGTQPVNAPRSGISY